MRARGVPAKAGAACGEVHSSSSASLKARASPHCRVLRSTGGFAGRYEPRPILVRREAGAAG